MPKIHVLPEDVARQIAAGEVVERPASVAKELIENALDAGARRIDVRVDGSGVKRIEVRDDGCGMSRDDVELAVRSYATSKITGSHDLLDIDTYGFRGEALPSISAVSRFEVVSSDRSDGEGWRLAVEGKSVVACAPAPHERGTTVRVGDLFFNTPARRKFLKSDITERRRILETILSFGLVFPAIELHYRVDGREELDLGPTASWRDRMASILGGSTMKHMVEVSGSSGSLRVTGFVSLPTHTRSSRNHQFFYVNGRPIREKSVMAAVQQAYRNVIPYKRFPVVILRVDMPPDEVDVNVHPTKREVRFKHERAVFDAVYRAIKTAVSGRAESGLEVRYPFGQSRRDTSPPGVTPLRGAAAEDTSAFSVGGDDGAPSAGASDVYRARVRDAYGAYMDAGAQRREPNPQLSLTTTDDAPQNTDGAAALSGEELQSRARDDDALFWQFNNTYIFIQVRGGVVVIDQHAAHERVIYDTCRRRLEREIPISQQILFPIHLELSLSELDVFRSSGDMLRKLGFHLEPFGGKSILVRGYPQGIKNWEEGRLLRQIFDDIIQERIPGNTDADRLIASFACRSAVKAGQELTTEEMKMLADQLFAVANPYSCPHGRPTIHRISLQEIEGWFLRR